jgi:predicted metal-dependent HD superfamily phosphohydrolase
MSNIEILIEAVNIARSYGFNITPDVVIEKYSESSRHWHTLSSHLYDMLNGIKKLYENKELTITEYRIFMVAAIFHDIIYDTNTVNHDNEEKSVEFMMSVHDKSLVLKDLGIYPKTMDGDIKDIIRIILGTKKHNSTDRFSKLFNDLDTNVIDADFIDLLDWENKIYQEYEHFGRETYKKKRIEFIENSIKDHPENEKNLRRLINFIKKDFFS